MTTSPTLLFTPLEAFRRHSNTCSIPHLRRFYAAPQCNGIYALPPTHRNDPDDAYASSHAYVQMLPSTTCSVKTSSLRPVNTKRKAKHQSKHAKKRPRQAKEAW